MDPLALHFSSPAPCRRSDWCSKPHRLESCLQAHPTGAGEAEGSPVAPTAYLYFSQHTPLNGMVNCEFSKGLTHLLCLFVALYLLTALLFLHRTANRYWRLNSTVPLSLNNQACTKNISFLERNCMFWTNIQHAENGGWYSQYGISVAAKQFPLKSALLGFHMAEMYMFR